MWYEYHRPRTPLVIRKPRIVGSRLVKMARFALDSNGFLPRDSVVVITPKQKAFKNLKSSLGKTLGRKVSEDEVLLYILAFLNSETFDQLLIEKISKKRGGYPIIDERLLKRLGIPMPTRASKNIVKKLLELVKKAVSQDHTNETDKEINNLVKKLYKEEKIKTKTSLRSFIK
jgi:F420-0:gamma-glutamyl ligase-like protein